MNAVKSIDDFISEQEKAFRNLNRPENKFSEARFAYSVPDVSTPSVGRSCDDVYKRYEEFVRACEGEFESSYKQAYVSSYERSFMNDYESFYAPEFDREFSSNSRVQFSDGKTQGYQMAYDEFYAKGASEVYQQGFDKGLKLGYEENIGEYSRQASEAGTRDARSHYAKNPLVNLGERANVEFISDAPKNELRSGATVSLRLKIKNVGGANLNSGKARIRLRIFHPNITANSQWVELPAISSNDEVIIDDLLVFKIKDQAQAGSRISFNLELESPGDEVDRILRDSLSLTKEFTLIQR